MALRSYLAGDSTFALSFRGDAGLTDLVGEAGLTGLVGDTGLFTGDTVCFKGDFY